MSSEIHVRSNDSSTSKRTRSLTSRAPSALPNVSSPTHFNTSPARTASTIMLSLPVDIQLLVLDYITLKSDLRALCATTKACRHLVLPRLYQKILLVTWDQQVLGQFAQCVARGAGTHLQFTRSLTFESNTPPSASYFHLTGHFPCAQMEEIVEDQSSPKVIESSILRILKMFPADCLHSFRYVSYILPRRLLTTSAQLLVNPFQLVGPIGPPSYHTNPSMGTTDRMRILEATAQPPPIHGSLQQAQHFRSAHHWVA